jgi:hypothetical protein
MAEAFLKQDVLECIWRYNNHDGGGGAGSVKIAVTTCQRCNVLRHHITSSCRSLVTKHALVFLRFLSLFDTFSGSFFKSGQGQ